MTQIRIRHRPWRPTLLATLAGIAAGSAVAWLLRSIPTKAERRRHVRLRILNGRNTAAHTAAEAQIT